MSHELIGVPQLAAALGKDQSTVHRRIAAGTLTPAAWVGRSPVFTAAQLAELTRRDRLEALADEVAAEIGVIR